MTRRMLIAFALSASLVMPLTISGQQPTPSPPPSAPQADSQDVVRITTNLVQVDVVVTKDGKLVTDLQADDFEILEDGKPQVITNFSYVSNVPAGAGTGTVNPAAKDKLAPPVPPAKINLADQRRVIAFVVDDLGMSFESMVHVRTQLKKFLAELSPNDLAAVVRTSGQVGSLQQFTNDQRILTDAVEHLRWNPCSRTGLYVFSPQGLIGDNVSLCSRYVLDNTLSSLRFILRGMGYLPGRKSMVLLSDYLPVEDEEDPFLQKAFKANLSDLSNQQSQSQSNDLSLESNQSYYRQLELVAELAIRSSVVIYGVDTRGLQYTGLTAQDRLTSTGQRGAIQEINQIMSSRSQQLIRGREGTDLIARHTGGFLIRNSNDFGFKQVLDDQQGYYLIGFRPAEDSFNREFHKIKAKLKRSGMMVRTRAGFYGFTNDEARPKQLSVADQMNKALISPFSPTDVNIRLTSFFVNDAVEGPLVRSFLYLDPRELTFRQNADGRRVAYVNIRAMIFGNNGRVLGEQDQNGSLRLSETDYLIAIRDGLAYSFDVPLKSRGGVQFRVAVRDSVSSRIGAAGQFVVIPNLKDGQLALSGIVARADSPQTPDPLPGSEGLTGIFITGPAVRRFPQGTDVRLAYAIYNAGATGRAPKLTSQVRIFRDGKIVFSSDPSPVKLQTQNDPERLLANSHFTITKDMPPGDYIFQIIVTDSQDKQKPRMAAQWIDFEVVK